MLLMLAEQGNWEQHQALHLQQTDSPNSIFEANSNTVKNATNVSGTGKTWHDNNRLNRKTQTDSLIAYLRLIAIPLKNATNVSGTGKLGTTSGSASTTNRQPDSIFEANSNTVKNATNATSATAATRATYASTDTSKGTIEQRLTNLGFKSGSISLSFGSATVNSVKRQGNYVVGNLEGSWTGTAAGASSQYATQDTVVTIGTLVSANFKPKTNQTIGAQHTAAVGAYSANAVFGNISTLGVVTVTLRVIGTSSRTYQITGLNFGFEANPL